MLFILMGCYRILFKSKQKIIEDEIQEEIAGKNRKKEDKNYESYEWVCGECRKILDSGKIEDHIKFSRLMEILDNNKKYDELKILHKDLIALEQKELEESYKKIQNARSHY